MSVSNRRARSHSPTAHSPAVATNHSFSGGNAHGLEDPADQEDSRDEGGVAKNDSMAGSAVGSSKSLNSTGTFEAVRESALEHKTPSVLGEEAWPDTTKLSARGILAAMKGRTGGKLEGKVLPSHDAYYTCNENLSFLECGGSLFTFTWRQPREVTDYEKQLINSLINLSSFKNELENGAGGPPFDVYDLLEAGKYSYLIQKSAYLLPGLRLVDLDLKWLSSYKYQKACQPASSYLWEDTTEENTFRMTKTIIRYIFSVTMQFKMSKVEEAVLPHLSQVLGVRIEAAVLLERTRRTANAKPDGSAKTKSILCYSRVDGGLLCTHFTIALQTYVPTIVTKILGSFGGRGLDEVNETAANTRRHLAQVLELSDA